MVTLTEAPSQCKLCTQADLSCKVVSKMKIEQFGPANADHSTGLILHRCDQLLFAVEPIRQGGDPPGGPLVRFVGIGGHLEPGETWTEAVRREAMEEAGLHVSLRSPEETYLLRDDGTVQDITSTLEWPDSHRPFFVWSAQFHFGRPPNDQVRHFVNAVFVASVPDDAQPRPAAEMPAILALSEAQLRQAAAHPVPLIDLLAGGAAIWESGTIPRSTRLVPGGSAQWYAALLDHLSGSQPV
jgi:8-oxo-dGTP pyrophosphatase MutT (NUDIX family)